MQSEAVLANRIFILAWAFRRLRRNYFECRAGLKTRLIFRAERGVLHFVAAGDHDEIQKFLKTL
jgi:hypothetical protein